ncbi:type IV pilus assembly protein PilM [Patescibacteria group bacterium]
MSTFFGLDIGTSQVKVLQAKKEKEGFEVDHFAALDIGANEAVQVARQAIQESGVKISTEVNLALPESDVYTRIVETPKLSDTELASSIRYEAEQYVPISLDQVELFHQTLEDRGEGMKNLMRVLLIALPKEKLKKLTEFVDQVGLIPQSLETELFALRRVFTDSQKSQVILLLGHKTTDLMLLEKGSPLFLHSMPSGSFSLTKTLMGELGLSEDQAEQYKRTYGIRADLLEGKVAKVLTPLVDEIITQISKSFMYVQQLGHKKLPEQIVITGGGALLPGLSSYLVKKLNVEVVVGDPFKRFVKDEEFAKKITQKDSPHLATVTGLALKGLI